MQRTKTRIEPTQHISSGLPPETNVHNLVQCSSSPRAYTPVQFQLANQLYQATALGKYQRFSFWFWSVHKRVSGLVARQNGGVSLYARRGEPNSALVENPGGNRPGRCQKGARNVREDAEGAGHRRHRIATGRNVARVRFCGGLRCCLQWGRANCSTWGSASTKRSKNLILCN